MGLVSAALLIYGTISDTIAVGEFIAKTLSDEGQSAHALFVLCFTRAVNRKRGWLSKFTAGKDPCPAPQ